MSELLKKAIESENAFKQFSETISKSVVDPKNNKQSKTIIDFVKVVIKNKKAYALQKVLALKLLNKCMMKNNKEFVKYFEKKILSRLTIFSEFNKEKQTS